MWCEGWGCVGSECHRHKGALRVAKVGWGWVGRGQRMPLALTFRANKVDGVQMRALEEGKLHTLSARHTCTHVRTCPCPQHVLTHARHARAPECSAS